MYKIIIGNEVLIKVQNYKNELCDKNIEPGDLLKEKIGNSNINDISVNVLLEKIIQTKKTQIYAESEIYGNGSDWNHSELSILGDVCISVPVTVFNNGEHIHPKNHSSEFDATLLYISGTLLRNDNDQIPADYKEIVVIDHINDESFYQLYERRLLPILIYINQLASNKNRKALITIPGLGCGQFAGKFQGILGEMLKDTLHNILKKYVMNLPNIQAVYFDPFSECENERFKIEHISYLVRPLLQGNQEKTQLCLPSDYEDTSGEFSKCDLYSLVAWDHVSWPGNDFYIGSRQTDDGVKAASTDSMYQLTGVIGQYNQHTFCYEPPHPYRNWKAVVDSNNLNLTLKNNLLIID
ncbi:hypothetical protein [Marinicellulosiphila megalodicopiae]|uniref:hypothetical protein n=1 Tax=Marinicellulosiphila megalodicopiae TaxID=2724896 RepID=UPI003BB13813